MLTCCLCLLAIGLNRAPLPASAAEQLPYQPVDSHLRVVRLDSHPRESFLAVHMDSRGRLFVGGREGVFAYDLDNRGQFLPRKLLYRFPDHTWVYDIVSRGDDLYVLTVSALYRLPEAVTRRRRVEAQRLVWGHPLGHVHQCFHGMALGPEGDLYFAMGDPLWYYGDFARPDHWGHWTFFSQPEGTRTPYTGVGGVFRCRPDGNGFQIVSRGLRNSCGLCFDRHWNLFTNDNDHEGLPAAYVPGRLVHVTPHTYFNWPRGWLLSKTPERADLLETMSEKLGRFVPVGQAYYDDPLIPELRNSLLVAQWGTRAVNQYPLEPRGASFRVRELPLLEGRDLARPVGVTVGRDGKIYATISYMAHNDASPVYQSDLVMIEPAAENSAPATAAGYEAIQVDDATLWSELSQPSCVRRFQAHQELLRRGPASLSAAPARLAQAAADDPARVHLVWLTAASGKAEAAAQLRELAAAEPRAEVRLQAVRVCAEYPQLQAPRDLFLRCLADSQPIVQHAALLGLFNFPGPVPAEVISGPARSADTYLRQAATLLLAEKSDLATIDKLCADSDRATRLAGLVAAGLRLTLPAATAAIPDHLPLDADFRGPEVAFFDANVDLRKLGRIGNFTTAEHWKAGQHTAEQEALFALLEQRLSDPDEQLRLQAAHYLELLNDPRSEPEVLKVRQANFERKLAIAPVKAVDSMWIVGPFADGPAGLQVPHPPEQGPIDLAARYPVASGSRVWSKATAARFFDFVGLLGAGGQASYYAYFRLDSPTRQKIHVLLGSDDGVRMWLNGTSVFINDVSRAALPFQDNVALELQAGSNDILVRVHNQTGSSGLYVHYRSVGELTHTLPDRVPLESLAERLKAAGGSASSAVPAQFLDVNWAAVVPRGDVAQGRKLFDALGCAKCHAVSAESAVSGGPSLVDSARRFTVAYLVESVLAPSKQISPVFRASAIVTADGLQHQGLVVGETADQLELLQSDTKRITVRKADVTHREMLNLSPMPQGVVKTPQELRDLVAFLLTVKSSP